MGLGRTVISLLAETVLENRKYRKAITIGRQSLVLTEDEKNYISTKLNKNHLQITSEYADEYIKSLLGLEDLKSMDISDYEGAEIIHDLNHELPEELNEKFDLLIDGGSLEHIFNIPEAIKSYMKLIKEGGDLFIVTVGNNHFGHGFYQLSPDFFYRVFSIENGFEVRKLIIEDHSYPSAELGMRNTCYEVKDPETLGKRVGLVSKRPCLIICHARRIKIKEIFKTFPIQSDYQSKSLKTEARSSTSIARYINKIINRLPKPLRDLILGNLQKIRYSFLNRSAYTKWKPFTIIKHSLKKD
ncbi:MAG: hypothetical protein R3A13_05600 [Bdellovibrionota bacterium]